MKKGLLGIGAILFVLAILLLCLLTWNSDIVFYLLQRSNYQQEKCLMKSTRLQQLKDIDDNPYTISLIAYTVYTLDGHKIKDGEMREGDLNLGLSEADMLKHYLPGHYYPCWYYQRDNSVVFNWDVNWLYYWTHNLFAYLVFAYLAVLVVVTLFSILWTLLKKLGMVTKHIFRNTRLQ